MASTSNRRGSSSASSSSSNLRRIYDVFLSFRGEDTRNSFVSHLYAALHRKGIHTYRDDVKLKKGREISPELVNAIEGSRFSIIVFSENYASSTWCLDELAKIMECKNLREQTVVPIFYNVTPSEVRKQTGKFAEALAKHEEDFKERKEEVQRWREVLTEAANLNGWDSQGRFESTLIDGVVHFIQNELKSLSTSNAEVLFGIDSHIEELNSLLCTEVNDVRFVGIWGMGGIGKTTIAEVVYDRIYVLFEGCCFLANVREHDSVFLQGKLLSKILMEGNVNIDTPNMGKNVIRERLYFRKVLIVLDNVDKLEQLEALAGKHDWFGPGSRIIITTRDKQLLIAHNVTKICKAKQFNRIEAVELFCWKAFGQKYPKEEYFEVVNSLISYANGLPLALKILGSFLSGRGVDEWKSLLNKLKKNPYEEIQKILRISYDALDDRQKNLFLDIACFFKGNFKEYIIKILESCEYSFPIDISVLVEKSLITIQGNRVLMHDLLQEMGRDIVRQQSPEEPGRRSRLWSHEDVCHVLSKKSGTEEVQAIVLDLHELKEVNFCAKAFATMTNLRLLKICFMDQPGGFEYLSRKELRFGTEYHAMSKNKLELYKDCKLHISGGFEFLSNKLRCLYWGGFPFKSFPTKFHPENIVELNMSYARIKQLWKRTMVLKNLKFLNLSHSHNLTKTPKFTGVPNLERLILEGCINLTKIHPSIETLKRLILLNLRDCENLRYLMGTINLESLESLILSGCSKLQTFPKVLNNMPHLWELSLEGTSIKGLPPSIEYLSGLLSLDLEECKSLEFLPSSMCALRSLEILSLSGCSKLAELFPLSNLSSLRVLCARDCKLLTIPNDIGCLSSLWQLNLGYNNFIALPSSISQLSELRVLYLDGCEKLRALPELPSRIYELVADGCTSLENQCTLSCLHGGFSNCSKLLENQCIFDSVEILAPNSPPYFDTILPGKEIRKWLSHQNMGDSVSVQLPPNWYDDMVGLTMCVVIKSHEGCCPSVPFIKLKTGYDLIVIGTYDYYFRSHPGFKSNEEHLWLDLHSLALPLSLLNFGCPMASNPQFVFDVFVSFRGEDTRNSFVSHLYATFPRKGIGTYMDDENLERGREISPELMKAIEGSRFSIIVFSENYAFSTWCLDELAKIMEYKNLRRQKVLPIFCDVTPSEVRNQTGKFAEAFTKHEEERKEKVQRWREALKEAADVSGWDTEEQDSLLAEKSLITIKLNMGRDIVRQELLSKKTRTENVPAVVQDLYGLKVVNFSAEAFATMTNLRLLKIYYFGGFECLSRFRTDEMLKNILELYKDCKLHNSAILEVLSDKLRCLHWCGFLFKSFPAKFHAENIVELNMSYARIKQLWKGTMVLKNLKFLNLSHSQNLTKTPKFTGVPNLERLILEGCINLIKIHPSIETLKRLILLNLRDCKNLKYLMCAINLESLESLILSGCSKLQTFPKVSSNMPHLWELSLEGTSIKELPPSIEYLSGLLSLDLEKCKNLKFLPSSICALRSLEILNLSGCSKLVELFPLSNLSSLRVLCARDCKLLTIPNDIGCLSSLWQLNLGYNNFIALPSSISQLSELRVLYLDGCEKLQALPELPLRIYELVVDGCTSLEIQCTLNCLHGGFSNCSKLLENQCIFDSVEILAPNSPPYLDTILLGKEIRKWYSVSIQLPPNWYDGMVGLTMYVVIKSHEGCRPSVPVVKLKTGYDLIIIGTYDYYFRSHPGFKSNEEHLWLGYLYLNFGNLRVLRLLKSKNRISKIIVDFDSKPDSRVVIEKCVVYI
ncbi:disease resistance-like protein DSC1 [Malania oleifera]|uniref:disease resistance-like protein DSC1 n=1 Tax=Malania oleifera TaxID=397392 RepID=UPI0025ADD34B|nr:disease resistance-like protein DSC1 [Malania oleifera]